MKKVLIAGASGMIGSLILDRCLFATEVNKVVSLVRKKSDNSHKKLEEIVVSDFSALSAYTERLQNVDAAFFCIGVYTGAVPDDTFKEITVDYAVSFASALARQSPKATLSFLSGQGADRTEKSRTSFAKYKGMAENQISALELNFHAFRPGYIYPVVPRNEPNFIYKAMRVMYPLVKMMGANMSIQSTELANAMYEVAMKGYDKEVLENRDIRDLLKK